MGAAAKNGDRNKGKGYKIHFWKMYDHTGYGNSGYGDLRCNTEN